MNYKKSILLIYTIILFVNMANAQTDLLKHDSSYYIRYSDKLIVTPFFSRSENAFTLKGQGMNPPLRYFTNMPVSFGLKLRYDWLSVSGSVDLGAADPDYSPAKGKTKSLGLQTTFVPKNFLVDVYFQNYTGMYLKGQKQKGPDYTRPDIRSNLYGATGLYLFNGAQFSARPGIKFDARQKRSAGSLLAGVEFLYGTVKGDSSLVPAAFTQNYQQSNTRQVNYILTGPGIGYGHSFVIQQHFFTTFGIILNGDLTRVKEYTLNETTDKHWSFNPNFITRANIGYNTDNFEVSFSYLSNRISLKGDAAYSGYFTNNNFYKLSYSKRLNAGKTIPKVVNWLGAIATSLGFGFIVN